MIELPDCRSPDPEAYSNARRRGQMKRSWPIGVACRRDGSETVTFDDGLTWGSIGQILGYLLGGFSEERKNELYDLMLEAYKQTDRGEGVG